MKTCWHCHASEIEKDVSKICECEEYACGSCADQCYRAADAYENWNRCWDCDGEGVVGHECGEDTCCCLYPEDNVTCSTCMGKGGWRMQPTPPEEPRP